MSGKGVDTGAAYQIRMLVLAVLFVFVLFSIFNSEGALVGAVHHAFRLVLGAATPLLAVGLIGYVLVRFFPDRFTPRLTTILGLILFVLAFTGLLHSFAVGVPLDVAQEGDGGGMLGYLVQNSLYSLVGSLVGRLILFVMMFISLILIIDKAIVPFLHPSQSDDSENEDDMSGDESDSRVSVKDIGSGVSPLDRLKQKLAKPDIQVAPIIPKSKVPVMALSRSANWNYPAVSLLDTIDMKPQAGNIQKRMEAIQKTLRDFGIDVTMAEVNVGPTVTQYTLKPAEGVKLNQITARQDDLALTLAAQSLRVEAPIPGKALVGIEIPNEKKATVGLRDILESKQFKLVNSKLSLALGRDAAGDPAIADLARMPHALVAGSTGSGKSVCINSIILTLLINNSPDELRMILVDPKRVELTGYNGIPHLLTPVITEPKDTIAALGWCVREMERRYKLFQRMGKRNIDQYNQEPDLAEGKLPFIVVIIDELADMMMVAAREVEGSIVRLAQMARAVGIHLIVATQRPSVDVITGLIKANIPTRIAFAVASQIDSRTILDMSGAEKLLGYGDMLYVSTDVTRPKRVQGVFATEKEINAIIAHIKMQEEGDRYDPTVLETRVESRLGSNRENGEIDDDLFNEAYEVVKQAGKASSTLLQTRLSVGYARAARLIQAMEDKGLIGAAKGSKPREVYGVDMSDETEEGGIAAYPESE
jgi:S-DNA-T family DNA segregation ATPase FtsK/SpoIIIE